MNKIYVFIGCSLLVIIVAIICYTQFTIFIVPPIGAVPDGRTMIISRLNKTNFIDSPDAMCERMQGGVSLLCRAMALGAVAENAKIHARLPYSEMLYSVSTGGKKYDR